MKKLFLPILCIGFFAAAQSQVNPDLINLPDNTWRQMTPTFEPPGLDYNNFGHPKTESQLVFDEENNVVVWFGGCSNGYTNSVWHYSVALDKWTRINDLVYVQNGVEAEGPFNWNAKVCYSLPGGQCHYSITYDSDAKRCIKGPGISSSFPSDQAYWAYDASIGSWRPPAWTKLVDLGAGHANIEGLTYDREHKKTILFGVYSGYGAGCSTEAFDFNATQWTDLNPANPPSDRAWAAFEYHQTLKKCVLFSGAAYSGPVKNDTWLYDYAANTWQEIHPSNPPLPRTRASMAYDSRNDVMIMFGGNDTFYGAGSDAGTLLHDTWILDVGNNSWTEMHPSTNPPNAKTWRGAYDPVNNVMVVVDMASNTWVYRYKNTSVKIEAQRVLSNDIALDISPNPFSMNTVVAVQGVWSYPVTLRLYDMRGRLAADLSSLIRHNKMILRAEGFAPGVYMMKLVSGNKVCSKPVMIVR